MSGIAFLMSTDYETVAKWKVPGGPPQSIGVPTSTRIHPSLRNATEQEDDDAPESTAVYELRLVEQWGGRWEAFYVYDREEE